MSRPGRGGGSSARLRDQVLCSVALQRCDCGVKRISLSAARGATPPGAPPASRGRRGFVSVPSSGLPSSRHLPLLRFSPGSSYLRGAPILWTRPQRPQERCQSRSCARADRRRGRCGPGPRFRADASRTSTAPGRDSAARRSERAAGRPRRSSTLSALSGLAPLAGVSARCWRHALPAPLPA